MKNIAIIKTEFSSDLDSYVARSITDWSEVSDEHFKILMENQWAEDYRVLERPINEPEWVANTIASYVKKVEKLEEQKKKDAEERAKKKLEADKKKKEKEAQKEKELFEQLKAKFGDK